MAIDARKHTVPAAGSTPRRSFIDDLSLSINDFIPVGSSTEQAQVVTDLTAKGVAPTAADPVFFYRTDTGALVRHNGTAEVQIAGPQTRVWESRRAAGPDAGFTTANTGLAGPFAPTVPAGTFRVVGRSVLYSAAGTDGNMFLLVNGVYEKARYMIPSGTQVMFTEISTTVVLATAGTLTVSCGYDVSSGTATNVAAGTLVRIEYLGL